MSSLTGVANELQISHFSFSAQSFHDCIFNITVDAWEEVCNDKFKAELKDLPDAKKREFLAFHYKSENLINVFNILKRFCVSDVFRIPNAVTLPAFEKMQKALSKSVNDEKFENVRALEASMENKLEEIRLLREKLETTSYKVEELDASIDILHTLEKAQEEMIAIRNNVPSSPLRTTSV